MGFVTPCTPAVSRRGHAIDAGRQIYTQCVISSDSFSDSRFIHSWLNKEVRKCSDAPHLYCLNTGIWLLKQQQQHRVVVVVAAMCIVDIHIAQTAIRRWLGGSGLQQEHQQFNTNTQMTNVDCTGWRQRSFRVYSLSAVDTSSSRDLNAFFGTQRLRSRTAAINGEIFSRLTIKWYKNSIVRVRLWKQQYKNLTRDHHHICKQRKPKNT